MVHSTPWWGSGDGVRRSHTAGGVMNGMVVWALVAVWSLLLVVVVVVAVVRFIVVGACHWLAVHCSWWVGVVGIRVRGQLLWVLVFVGGFCWRSCSWGVVSRCCGRLVWAVVAVCC